MNSHARPRVCLFAGPSLSAADVQDAFAGVDADVTVLPPIEQGDILRLADTLPDVIGIVDGTFFHGPAVLHREILFALEHGVRILGAASIGALRAAELDRFGMEGIGEVYRRYRAGTISADDEVAVLHGAAADAYRPLTEALVTIRHQLRLARRQRVISSRAGAAALRAMRRLHFTHRTRAALLATMPDDERAALARFLEHEAVDLKRQDARQLVRTIANRIAGRSPWPRRVHVRLNQTSLFHHYRREYVGRQLDGGHVPDDLVLKLTQLLSPAFRRLYAQMSWRCLALDEAAERGLSAGAAPGLIARFRREYDLGSDVDFQAWCRRRWLSKQELVQTLRERDLANRLRVVTGPEIASAIAARTGIPKDVLTRPLLIQPGVPWRDILIRELKFRGRFAPAVGRAHRVLRHNEGVFARHPWLVDAPVRRAHLLELIARHWRVAPEQVEVEMLARGFTGYDDCVEAARHVFVYERTSSGPYSAERLTDCFHVECEEVPARRGGSPGAHGRRRGAIVPADRRARVPGSESSQTSHHREESPSWRTAQ